MSINQLHSLLLWLCVSVVTPWLISIDPVFSSDLEPDPGVTTVPVVATASDSLVRVINFKRPGPPPDKPDLLGAGGANRKSSVCESPTTNGSNQIQLISASPPQAVPASNFPTLWFDVLYSTPPSSPIVGELSIEYYETNQRLEPKIIKVQLPMETSMLGLELRHPLDQTLNYLWYLYVQCPTADNNIEVSGEINPI